MDAGGLVGVQRQVPATTDQALGELNKIDVECLEKVIKVVARGSAIGAAHLFHTKLSAADTGTIDQELRSKKASLDREGDQLLRRNTGGRMALRA